MSTLHTQPKPAKDELPAKCAGCERRCSGCPMSHPDSTLHTQGPSLTDEERKLQEAGYELSDPLDRPAEQCLCLICRRWYAALATPGLSGSSDTGNTDGL